MMRSLKKSTTLFPQRFDKSEWCESLGKTQDLSKVSSQPMGSSVIEMPNTPSSTPSTSASLDLSPKRKKPFIEMDSLKCFMCNRIVKTDHISEHLVFGEVNCTKCQWVFKDCQGFQLWSVEREHGDCPCEHVLQYSKDPLKSLDVHLSNQYLENGTNGRASLIDRPGHLKAYIRGMKPLKSKMPWHGAIVRFTSFLKGEDVDVKRDVSTESGYKFDNLNHVSGSHLGDSSTNCPLETKDDVHVSNTNGVGTKDITNTDQSLNLPNHSFAPVSGKISPKKTSGREPNVPNKKIKSGFKKRKKSEWVSNVNMKKRSSASKAKDSVAYVETPLDGFYYVVRHAVTECPNCYAGISPPDFTVNIVTFLMTAVCRDCGLTIYIVHDPPDESGPRVCIVTAENKHKTGRKKTC